MKKQIVCISVIYNSENEALSYLTCLKKYSNDMDIDEEFKTTIEESNKIKEQYKIPSLYYLSFY